MSQNGVQHSEEQIGFFQVRTMDELLGVWPFVKRGIERIKERDKSCGSWTDTQIFNAVKFGLPTLPQRQSNVELFVAMQADKKLRSFMVTTPKLDPFMNNHPCGIHVWLMYADKKMMVQFMPELERLAKLNGGDQIIFETGRLGWLGRCGKLLVDSFRLGRLGKLGFRLYKFTIVKDIKW